LFFLFFLFHDATTATTFLSASCYISPRFIQFRPCFFPFSFPTSLWIVGSYCSPILSRTCLPHAFFKFLLCVRSVCCCQSVSFVVLLPTYLSSRRHPTYYCPSSVRSVAFYSTLGEFIEPAVIRYPHTHTHTRRRTLPTSRSLPPLAVHMPTLPSSTPHICIHFHDVRTFCTYMHTFIIQTS
jgi:hypothetical protein